MYTNKFYANWIFLLFSNGSFGNWRREEKKNNFFHSNLFVLWLFLAAQTTATKKLGAFHNKSEEIKIWIEFLFCCLRKYLSNYILMIENMKERGSFYDHEILAFCSTDTTDEKRLGAMTEVCYRLRKQYWRWSDIKGGKYLISISTFKCFHNDSQGHFPTLHFENYSNWIFHSFEFFFSESEDDGNNFLFANFIPSFYFQTFPQTRKVLLNV